MPRGILRVSDIIMAIVCSAVVTTLPPGVFITTTPWPVAAGMSTLSRPIPARPTTFRFEAAASSDAVTLVALRDHQRVISTDDPLQFLRRQAGLYIHRDAVLLCEHVDSHLSQIVADQYFHVFSPLRKSIGR